MLKVKTCLSITWDKNYFVHGALLCKRGKKFTLLDFAFSDDKNIAFSQRLSEVYNKLDGFNRERVVIGGYVANALTFSIDIPNLKPTEIKKFLEFEIGRYIPGNLEDFTWIFRPVIYPGADKSKIQRAKVFAVHKKTYDQGAKDMMDSAIKYDAFLYPFFVIDPFYTAFDLYLESIDENFYSSASIEEEGWFMSAIPKNGAAREAIIEDTNFAFHRFEPVLKENLKYYIPGIILAEYALNPTFNIEKKHFFPVPPLCKPRRFKVLKLATFALFILFAILTSSYIFREAIDNYKTIGTLNNQLKSLKIESDNIKKKIAKEKKTDDFVQLILTSEPDDIDAMSFLDYLSKVTPKDVWANYLNTYGNSANLTMQTNGNSDRLISELYKSTDFTLQNSRKNKSSDNSEYIYISLVKKAPENSTETNQ
ncbi:MAG: hypothetical protein WCR55_05810 [Lentisphaerota bacterium]